MTKNQKPADVRKLLSLLVGRYEQARYPIPAADPVSVVRSFIEQQHPTQCDLIPQFGSKSAMSMFLASQRKFALEQVRRLSASFKMPADVFMSKEPR